VARIWSDVLGIDNIASEGNFFELGGDSIKLSQIVSRLRTELKTEIPFRLLFDYPVLNVFVKELAERFLEGSEIVTQKPDSMASVPLNETPSPNHE
jgi:polyketide synthase PksJ